MNIDAYEAMVERAEFLTSGIKVMQKELDAITDKLFEIHDPVGREIAYLDCDPIDPTGTCHSEEDLNTYIDYQMNIQRESIDQKKFVEANPEPDNIPLPF